MKAEVQKRSEKTDSFTQGSMTVEQYFDEFHILSSRVGVDQPKNIIVDGYKHGFSKPVRNILHLYTINTIVDAYPASTQAETNLATNSALPLRPLS